MAHVFIEAFPPNPSFFDVAELSEQRASVKFCFLLGKSAAETAAMLQAAYKHAVMSKTRVYEWFSRFKSGQTSLEDGPRSGRPSTSRTDENIAKIKELVMEDRRRTIAELVYLPGVSWSSCRSVAVRNCETETSRHVAKQGVVVSSRQCSCAH